MKKQFCILLWMNHGKNCDIFKHSAPHGYVAHLVFGNESCSLGQCDFLLHLGAPVPHMYNYNLL